MNPLLSHALCQTLLHHGSGEDAVTQLSVGRQEFKEAYYAVANQIPGLTLDFEKLAAKDPIESDPLIAQGNLAILRLDDLYRETFNAWRNHSQGQELSANKRTIKPESFERRTDRSEKTEITTKQTTPDATLINQAVNIVLASFRIQATLTHRREQLTSKGSNDPNAVGHVAPATDALPKAKQLSATVANETISNHNDLINHTESLDETLDDFLDQPEKPIQKIRGLNRLTKLNGYKTLDPAESPSNCQQPGTPSNTISTTPASSPPPDHCSSKSSSSVFIPAKYPLEDSNDPEPYLELPPYAEISFQPPEVQEFLRSLKEQPTFTNTS